MDEALPRSGALAFVYALYIRDPVFILGQGFGLFVYLPISILSSASAKPLWYHSLSIRARRW
jgi:lipid-A-disaccharide synthase-like uncharacterized protein